MRIKSYESTRFAGLKDTRLDFEKGMNVILGPNESGKSTIIDGIHSTLFKNIRLKKNNNADIDFSFKFMPQPTGDFIDGKVVIKAKDGEYILSKEWGSSENIELLTPSGNILKSEKDIKDELSDILIYGESTYSNIVFAKQRELKEALFNIINDSEVTKEINDLLRRALMELDGISIDSIQKNIEDEIDDLYKRWNRERNYPENNRGVNNPYKVGLGLIIETYYKKENLKLLMEKADKSEKEFDKISKNIKDLEDKIKVLHNKKVELEGIEEDVNNRMIFEAEKKLIDKEIDEFKEVNSKWPITELRLEQLSKEKDELKIKREKLDKEKNDIEKVKNREILEKKLKSIEEILEKIRLIEDELNKIPDIKTFDIEKLSGLEKKVLTLETTMKASKMIGTLKKAGDKSVYISRDFGEKELLEVGVDIEANGSIVIGYDNEFEMEIKTGDLDFAELSNTYNDSKLEYEELLNSLNIDSLESGRLNLKKINDNEKQEESLNQQLEYILDNKSKEDLEDELKELEGIKLYRSLEEIEKEFAEINKKESENSIDIKIKENNIKSWEEKYKDKNNLLDLFLEKRAEFNESNKKIESLKPLPKEFASAKEFKESLKDIKEILNSDEDKLKVFKEKYYEAKNNLLDTSFEEYKREYLQAEKEFERNIRRGEKILEIYRVFLETKENLSKDPMEPLVNEFARLLGIITNGSYKTGEIDEEFNIKLENHAGEIPIELLSAGTYDAVTLALRFSLLKHIFKDKNGYVVLDDCLVDLDPNRKAQSIKLIDEFSKDYQIIFTTCDPETAKMLGGNLIEL